MQILKSWSAGYTIDTFYKIKYQNCCKGLISRVPFTQQRQIFCTNMYIDLYWSTVSSFWSSANENECWTYLVCFSNTCYLILNLKINYNIVDLCWKVCGDKHRFRSAGFGIWRKAAPWRMPPVLAHAVHPLHSSTCDSASGAGRRVCLDLAELATRLPSRSTFHHHPSESVLSEVLLIKHHEHHHGVNVKLFVYRRPDGNWNKIVNLD